jgi:putative transposase
MLLNDTTGRNGLPHYLAREWFEVADVFIESVNGKFRTEYLNQNWFLSLADVRDKIDAWRQDNNRTRPHNSLDNLTPQEFALRCISPATPPEYNKVE